MIITLKILMVVTLGTIAYQDIKDRLVWWFLYPIAGFLGALFFWKTTYPIVYFYSVSLNVLLVGFLLIALWCYVRIIIKKPFFKEVFGLGEVLLLAALAISFSTLSFLVILFFSLVFSMIIQLVIGIKNEQKTVPAAGYISIFLIGIYFVSWAGLYNNLYAL